MKLYQLSEQFRELEALVDSGELTAEMVADTVDAIELQMEDKFDACLKMRQELLAAADGYGNEANRLASLQSQAKAKADSLLEYVKLNMIAVKKNRLNCGLFKLTLRKPADKLGALDEDKIPAKYFDIVPESKKLDKRRLLKDAKEGAIDGVTLAKTERSLQVK